MSSMFLDPLKQIAAKAWNFIQDLNPFVAGRPHFNFITVHYMYLICLSLLGSVIVFGIGGLDFTDCLFFSAGASTQSGLNTVNVNQMYFGQQFLLWLIACIANPIFINTFVVFIRLYWFEKRFRSIVKEARSSRRSRTRSRTVSESRADPEIARTTQGVNGRTIKVLHETTTPNGMNGGSAGEDHLSKKEQHELAVLDIPKDHVSSEDSQRTSEQPSQAESSGEGNTEPTFLGRHPGLKREITFADEVKPQASSRSSSSSGSRRPGPMSSEHHIAFLEKQRKQDQGTLYIPGPRDFDRGDVPREVDSDEEGNELTQVITRDFGPETQAKDDKTADSAAVANEKDDRMNRDDHPTKRNIAFNEPDRPGRSGDDNREAGGVRAGSVTRWNPLHPFTSVRHRRDPTESSSFGRSLSTLKDRSRTFSFTKSQDRDMAHPMPYLSWQPTIGRNSAFIDLTEEQREELGGIEYRSLKTLAIILVVYYLGWHLTGIVVFTPWIYRTHWGAVVTGDDQARTWWAIFTSASMFNDLGFTLTPDSMESFQSAVVPLLLGSFLIIIGNTGFPVMLRFTIWVLSKIVPVGGGLWEELRFLLDHPRRCFTLLFPSQATWWLFWILVILNGIDLIFFIILDLSDDTVTSLAPGYRVLNGWFQAASTRTAGFACVNLADLHPAIQVSYLIMMYISVLPIAISVRKTNVYEEKSLGLWGGEDEDNQEGKSYVGQHLRRQLSFDLWYIFMGLFIIAIVEGGRLADNNDPSFTLFAVLFEIVSAYGTVGLSLGYPTNDASLSAEFAILSKLIIVAMMLRGRHRGLPYALDRAILLPSENLHKKEDEDARRRPARRNSFAVGTSTTFDKRSQIEGRDQDAPPSPTLSRSRNTGNSAQSPDTPNGPLFSSQSPGPARSMTRRGSEVSDWSQRGPTTDKPKRRLSNFIVGGLSPGLTNFKED